MKTKEQLRQTKTMMTPVLMTKIVIMTMTTTPKERKKDVKEDNILKLLKERNIEGGHAKESQDLSLFFKPNSKI